MPSLPAPDSSPVSADRWISWRAHSAPRRQGLYLPCFHPQEKDGSLKSNIVPFIPGGSTVSAPRTMIQYVATEYGIAKLTGLTLKERADAMIAIAHPDFRDELRRYAEENFK